MGLGIGCSIALFAWVVQQPAAPSALRSRLREQAALRRTATKTDGTEEKKKAEADSGKKPSTASPNGSSAASSDTGIDYRARAKKGKFSFEFSKAEIVDIVKAISEMTRKNFIIPEKLKSQRITVLSPSKITAAEAYQIFLTALAANGITLVRVGKFYKLVESKEAIKTTIPTCVGPEDVCPSRSELMVTVLIHLQHIEASQINPVVKSLISKAGELTVFSPTNALIVSEYAPNLERIKRIISALDQPGSEDELKLVQIENAAASEISSKLTEIFEVEGRNQGGRAGRKRANDKKKADPADDEQDVRISKIVADDRTNQLIIKANRRSFEAIKRVIDLLDVPTEDAGRIRVLRLENASAEDLASTLSSLTQTQANRRTPPRGQGNNQAQRNTNDAAVLFQGDVQITADKATNSLIVVASSGDFRSLRRLVEKLDVPRRQVYVEAAILEVTVSDSDEFGINWHAPAQFSQDDLGSTLGGAGTIGFAQSAQGDRISPTLVPLTDPTALLNVAGGSVAGIIGKGLDIPLGDGNTLTVPSFGIVLRWLQTSSKANVLSTPHILTTDNEEASIEVGERIPFRRGTSIPAGVGNLASGTTANQLSSFGSLFSSTDRIDVTLKLTLTPQINERDKVRLEIDQQIEDITGIDEPTGQPKTSTRSAKTTVVVDDQQTVVLGGLIRDKVVEGESKIPLLGDLPLIGWFFKQRDSSVEKVNLLLVLTPYIVREADDFQRIFERKMREYEEFAAEYYGDTPEYRAHIDYRRKTGPLARLMSTVSREMAKPENGGAGDDALIVGPEPEPSAESPTVPSDAISEENASEAIEPGSDAVVDDGPTTPSSEAPSPADSSSSSPAEGEGLAEPATEDPESAPVEMPPSDPIVPAEPGLEPPAAFPENEGAAP